jgi:hypothetical protein
MRSPRLIMVVLVLAASADACGTQTVTPLAMRPMSASPTNTSTPQAALSVEPSPTALSGSPAPAGIVDLKLDFACIPDRWALSTGPSVASDGTTLVWTAIGSLANPNLPTLPDLVGFAPGHDSVPHYLYRGPNRDSFINAIAVSDGHYAFVEDNDRLYGTDGWALWALPGAGQKAILLDKGDVRDAPQVGSIAMGGGQVIWTTFHEVAGVVTSEIRAAHFDGSDPRVLASAPASQTQYWWPSFDLTGRFLLYGTVEHPSGGNEAFRIYRRDLSVPDSSPVRLGTDDTATEPLSNGRTLVWRTVNDNVINWGADLVIAAPDGQSPKSLSLPNVNFEYLGNRYLAYWRVSVSWANLTLYDTATGTFDLVEQHGPSDPWQIQEGWTIVAGDLLVLRRATDASTPPPQVCWASLPHVP